MNNLSILFLLLSTLGVAGHNQGHGETPAVAAAGIPEIHQGQYPTATFDHKGRLWVVFVYGNGVWVSRSDDFGAHFSKGVRVNSEVATIEAYGESRPQIAVDKQGRVFVCYTKIISEEWSGNLMFSRSTDGGKSFETPRKINDDTEVTTHSFAVMALDGRDRLYLAWIDGRDRIAAEKKGETLIGSSIYTTSSSNGGVDFGPNLQWVKNVCECCRLAIAFDQKHRPLLMWRHIFGDHIRDHGLGRATDRGDQFRFRRLTRDNWRIEGCPHQGPALFSDVDGGLHAAWFTMSEDKPLLQVSRVNADEVVTNKPHGLQGNRPRYPALADSGKVLYLAWLDDGEDQSTQLRIAVSSDRGVNWHSNRVLLQSEGVADHPFLLSHGEHIYATWKTQEGFKVTRLKD